MAKSDQKDVQKRIYNQADSSNSDFDAYTADNRNKSGELWGRSTQDYTDTKAGYDSYAQGGGLTPEQIANMRNAYGAIGGAGGGVSNPLAGKSSNLSGLNSAFAKAYRPNYKESDSVYRDATQTGLVDNAKLEEGLTGFRGFTDGNGGFDANQLQKIYGDTDSLREIGQTGGINSTDEGQVMRDTLKEFEQTGGYSTGDRANIRARSAASAPAFYSAVKDDNSRMRGITGNLAGATKNNFKLAREQSRAANDDRVNTEIGLADSIRAGRSQASDTLADNYMNMLGLRTTNQLQGTQAAGQLGLNTQTTLANNKMRGFENIDASNRANQELISRNKLQGAGGLAESQTNLGQWGLGQAGGLDQFGLSKASGMDQWDISNAGRSMSAQSSNSAAARQGAAANAEMEKFLLTYGNDMKQYGIEGQNDLYKTNLGAGQNYDSMGLDALNSKHGNANSLLGLAAQNRGRTGMENFTNIAGAVGGIAGAFMPGMKPQGSGITDNPADTGYRPGYRA